MTVKYCPNISETCRSTSYTDELTAPVPQYNVPISKDFLRIYQLVCLGIICQAINVFGTVTNIINIMCFVKQGFKEPVNISLLGLAVSDIGCLVTMLLTNICFIPAFQDADLPFDPEDVQYLVFGMPHIVFTRVTSSITAFITLERCLCITMPIRVKSIFTPKRAVITIVCIYVFFIASVSPIYYSSRFDMKFVLQRNKTVLGLTYTDDRLLVEMVTFSINNILMPLGALLIITVCMVITVMALQRQAKWRSRFSNSKKRVTISASDRDRRVAKMVLMISVLFIVCFMPSGAVFLAAVIMPELRYGGKYLHFTLVAYAVVSILESANSSMNIFIYYHRSSRYREIFRKLFSLDKGDY